MKWSELKERVDKAIESSGLTDDDVYIEYLDVSDRRLRQQQLYISVGEEKDLLVWTK